MVETISDVLSAGISRLSVPVVSAFVSDDFVPDDFAPGEKDRSSNSEILINEVLIMFSAAESNSDVVSVIAFPPFSLYSLRANSYARTPSTDLAENSGAICSCSPKKDGRTDRIASSSICAHGKKRSISFSRS